MKTTAIISEYNPYHNGHKYLVDKARDNGATHITAIMGGSFLQRGNCAVTDKYSRAAMAVAGGVDLVLELPQIYAAASAERFSLGACTTLESCGCIDELAFGCECNSLNDLLTALKLLDNNEQLQSLCKAFLKKGLSYPRAVQSAADKLMPDSCAAQVLKMPNNTLALEYIRALNRLNSRILPFAVRRQGAFHNSQEQCDGFASASAVRSMIQNGDLKYLDFIPDSTAELLARLIEKGKCPATLDGSRSILAVLRRMSLDDIKALPDVAEGLENRLFKAIREHSSVSDIIEGVKCKRYTHARLSRITVYAYLGITRELYGLSPQYIRVLAFNDKGTEILKVMKASASLPIVMSPARDMSKLSESGKRLLEVDIRASDLYGLLTPSLQGCSTDYYVGAVYYK